MNNMSIDQTYDYILSKYGNIKFIDLNTYDKKKILEISETEKYLTDEYCDEEEGLYKNDGNEAEHKRNEFAKKYNYRKLYIISHLNYIISTILFGESELVGMLNFSIIKGKLNKDLKLTRDATIMDYAAIFESATIKQMLTIGI
jgi:hypothetical protein